MKRRLILLNRIKLVFEETMQMLVPRLEPPHIQAVCAYAEDTERAEWTIRYGGGRLDMTTEGSDLALMVLRGMTEHMEYTWEEDAELGNVLTVKVR